MHSCPVRFVAFLAALIAVSTSAQAPVHPKVIVLVDTSSTMTEHLGDNCSSGGDGSTSFVDAGATVSTLYRGLPAPLDGACMFTCTSSTFDGTNSRLYAAKTALTNILNSNTRIDWGLMRYTGAQCAISGNPFQPHSCTTTCPGSGVCSGGVCRGTTSFDCAPGEILSGGVCGTDANLCHTSTNYQEANCSTTRSLGITYTGSCGTSALAGSAPCATLQSCYSDSDCSGTVLGRCALIGSGPARACGGTTSLACPSGYVLISGRCVYNNTCQSIGGLILADPVLAGSTAAALPYLDGVENYTASGSVPANPELRADGASPLGGAVRSATTWYSGIKNGSSDPSLLCRPYAMVLIVDGTDSCETDPAGPIAAVQGFVAATATGAAHLNTVHVIALGFPGGNSSLDAIAHAGGSGAAHFIASEAQIETALSAIAASLLPAASVTGSSSVCANGTAGTATSTNATAWGYRTVSGGTVTAIPGATNATYLIKGSDFPGPGQFYLVAGSCNFGSVSDEIVITVLAPPSATITAPAQVVANRTASASVPDAGASSSYTWSVTGATFTGQGTRAITFTAGSSGSVGLNVTVQSAAGCIANGSQSVPIIPPFTDDPLVPSSTLVKAIHLAEVRDSVNALRAKASLAAASWTDTAAPGLVIKATHIIELRNALTPALTALGTTPTYTDPSLGPGDIVKAAHIQEIREYTR